MSLTMAVYRGASTLEAGVSSELVDRYKTLTAELTRLEQEAEKIKGEREVICEQLLEKDKKGFAYDLGDGMPMVVATTKNRKHYMAPKNKWVKAGRPPKPPKAPRMKKEPKPAKEQKPLVRRAIVGGKLVEIPIGPRKSAPPPAPVAAVEPERVVSEPPPPVVVEKPEPQKPRVLDPLEEALAALDVE